MGVKQIFSIVVLFCVIKLSEEQLETFEPTEPVCKGECDCQIVNDALLLNCTDRDMTHVLAQWPPHPEHIIASFNWNKIKQLQQMPTTDAKTISLSYSHCEIQSLASALFINAVGIEFLDLSWNLLTGHEVRADVFRGRYNDKQYEPINLKQLDLSHNYIESLPASIFEHTPKLRRLNLSHNPLHILDLRTINALTYVLTLEALNLANTSLSVIPTNAFSRLRKLNEIDLSDNKFQHVPEALALLSASLQKLTLDGNPIEHLEDHDFIGLHVLQELRISRMNYLKRIYHNTFAFLPKLKVLNCSQNPKLNQIHQHAFGKNSSNIHLTEVYLSDNNLETIDYKLLNWSQLSVLDLNGNRWLCDCEMFKVINEITQKSKEIIMPAATCSQPTFAAGIALNDVQNLGNNCQRILEMGKHKKSAIHLMYMRSTLILSIIFLIFLACFMFWKLLLKYKSMKAINTTYPVVYISAPNYEI